MKSRSLVLERRYRTDLHRYLRRGPVADLRLARRLGRAAMALGLETLDLARIHEHSLLAQLASGGALTARERTIQRARAFFAGAITPMEETHRSAMEAAANLSRLNLALNRRTLDLSVSNRELKREIVRRHVVEKTLRQSERHSNRLLEESRNLQEQLRLLSRRVMSVQEEERKRISRELHDVIAQMLTGINVRLSTLKLEAEGDARGLGQKIARTQRLVEKSVDVVHRFARELRPAVLDDLGLIPALRSFMNRFMAETGIRTSLTAFSGVEALSSAKRTALYRVAQEALTNVARHSRAARVDVILQKLRNAIQLQVRDDGKSFDAERILHARKIGRMGLLGMRERIEMVGGTFTVESAPGKGTSIQARVPFKSGGRGHIPA
ncbi:MAG: sensor histidine kinase [Verrucomicrobia bacterium]|nr:sensor histidine kinase [Verrucomicrobiota bacterium]